MAKFIVGCIIIVISTVIGGKLTDKYRRRAEFYEALKDFNLKLKQNLLYKKDKLYIVADYKSGSPDFNITLEDFRSLSFYGKSNNTDIFLPSYLSVSERDFVEEYFLAIGKGNVRSEAELICSYEYSINEKLSKMQDENTRFSKLGRKVGLAVGLTVFILVV